jgi:hypothetical protein
MKPTKFEQQNITYAENQPGYLPLPAHRTHEGEVITCWKLSWRERIKILLTGILWWRQLTFNNPLQPQSPSVDGPFIKEVSD